MGEDVGGKIEGYERNTEVDRTLSWETVLSGIEGGSARKTVCRGDKRSHLGCSLSGCFDCFVLEL